MELRQLEALRLIIQTGSFSIAARGLGLTQSALSHQIRSLEEEFAEQLLVRARPRVHPTAAGQMVLLSTERILEEIAQLKAQFGKARNSRPITPLRLAATHLAITYIYGDLLELFSHRHPEVDLVFHATETTDAPVQRVLQRESDVGFTVLPVKHPKLEAIQLLSVEQVLIVSPKHPLARQKLTTVEELRHWSFARFEPGNGGRQMSDALFVGNGGYPSIIAESNDIEYLKRIIQIGLGVTLVPVFCVHNELKQGTLRALRLRSGRIIQKGGLVTYKGANNRALQVFTDACRALRGSKPRIISLESAAEPIFAP